MPTPSWEGSVTVYSILSSRVFNSLERRAFRSRSELTERSTALSCGITMTGIRESDSQMMARSEAVKGWAQLQSRARQKKARTVFFIKMMALSAQR